MRLEGNATVVVNQGTIISCSSDLNVMLMEWTYAGSVITNSTSSQVDLILNSVPDYFHNRRYTCRGTTLYGVQERSVNIEILSELH